MAVCHLYGNGLQLAKVMVWEMLMWYNENRSYVSEHLYIFLQMHNSVEVFLLHAICCHLLIFFHIKQIVINDVI